MRWLTQKLVLLLCSMTAVVSCDSNSPADALVADPAALKRGKSIFIGTCGGYCHSTMPGPRDAPFLFDCVWIHGGSDQEIFSTVSNGIPNTTMVSFSGMLPEGDDDIWRVIAYLRSNRGEC